ncbi:uncharacterized protein Z518_06330 [Rhinocladiella mackenziei CBS 650.93]|uniref:Phosphoglycerate mutase-like protein n=1 Tax=Rhinocladiella mackenziei CBS 650.93 TaxID=1442369 RepID=A0A0D2H4Y4_9EURO|nr:uncharacterized protein Z518_06330 [Rhinocladiella mackenziei CBS 650.93]KIX05458.1 hypothetical protein Z518_06330 [Rhinocladiella mackenziei CBS 650.93]
MHLFLVRHGETEHNIAGLLAGVSDSRLTNHGVAQTQRLGRYLTTHRNLRFTRIYASDLQRAYMTAEELQRHQAAKSIGEQRVPEVVKLELLREQDFGSLELAPWTSRRAQHAFDPHVPNQEDPSFRPQETAESMQSRADSFLADFILPLLATYPDDAQDTVQECVAVVSHGLFLSVLWQSLLSKFNAHRVTLGPNVEILRYGRPLEYLPAWNNTAFLELTIHRVPTKSTTSRKIEPAVGNQRILLPLSGHSMTVHVINGKDHLLDLKRAPGGLGSSPYDARQKSLDGFFKGPKCGGPGSKGIP